MEVQVRYPAGAGGWRIQHGRNGRVGGSSSLDSVPRPEHLCAPGAAIKKDDEKNPSQRKTRRKVPYKDVRLKWAPTTQEAGRKWSNIITVLRKKWLWTQRPVLSQISLEVKGQNEIFGEACHCRMCPLKGFLKDCDIARHKDPSRRKFWFPRGTNSSHYHSESSLNNMYAFLCVTGTVIITENEDPGLIQREREWGRKEVDVD